ncbi:adenosylcobinamide-GDP ribazoletransferase [Priestia megaterium]|nr:adenosylcobinamide-GDP ribazoletransferase [Priestia megaterium]
MKESIIVIRIALQFFTILPTAKTIEWTEKRTAHAIFMLPWVGMLIGFCTYVFLELTQQTAMSILAMSMLVVIFSLVFTGGLHMDGWMDVSDAYFSQQSRAKKLQILSDPHIGAFAVLSLLGLLAFRFISIHELLGSYEISMWTMLLVFTLPRIVAGFLLMMEKPAKETGLASYFQKGVTKKAMYLYIAMSVILVAVLANGVENKLVFLLFCFYVVFWVKFYRSQFGGITGDIIGATIEGGETGLWIMTWLLHLFVMG